MTTNTQTAERDPFTYINSPARYTSEQFYGVMIDTGASQRSTAGYGQYLAYKNLKELDLDLTQAGAVNVQFCIGSTTSIGAINVKMPIGTICFHVIKADTPFLLCLKDMDTLKAYYNNITDKLITPTLTLPITLRYGHPFLLWDESLTYFISHSLDQNPCYLTVAELRRLHRRFGHPSTEKLLKLLERSGHEVSKKSIEYLTKFCAFCRKHGRSPGRFKFTLREDLEFNHTILVDIMYIDGSPILHIIDEATHFQAARWLQNISAKHTWDILRVCWIDTYVGPPDLIIHDAGTNFSSKEFHQCASSLAISTKTVPVEAHWSVGLIERAYPILRRAKRSGVQ